MQVQKRSYEENRKAYLVELTKRATKPQQKEAALAAGINWTKNLNRTLVKRLEVRGDVRNAPHNRKCTVYTPELLQEALDVAANADGRITVEQLLSLLTSLPAGHHDKQYFTQKLREFCNKQGLRFQAFSTDTKVFLQNDDFPKRVEYAKRMLSKLDSGDYQLGKLVFVDETSIQESAHPKCKCKDTSFSCLGLFF